MVQTLKILTDAYTNRIVQSQSTLKNVSERYFWNGLSRKRFKAIKVLYALKVLGLHMIINAVHELSMTRDLPHMLVLSLF